MSNGIVLSVPSLSLPIVLVLSTAPLKRSAAAIKRFLSVVKPCPSRWLSANTRHARSDGPSASMTFRAVARACSTSTAGMGDASSMTMATIRMLSESAFELTSDGTSCVHAAAPGSGTGSWKSIALKVVIACAVPSSMTVKSDALRPRIGLRSLSSTLTSRTTASTVDRNVGSCFPDCACRTAKARARIVVTDNHEARPCTIDPFRPWQAGESQRM